MRNVSEKDVEKIITKFYVQKLILLNSVVYEEMWKNIVETGRPQMTIWRMRIAC
jgi:hypothetical protein